MKNQIYSMDEIKKKVMPIAIKYDLSKVYIFGSYARGEANEKSDIDLRIDGGNIRTLFDWGAVYSDLEDAFAKSIDLIMTDSLREKKNDPLTRKLIKQIKEDEVLLYDKV